MCIWDKRLMIFGLACLAWALLTTACPPSGAEMQACRVTCYPHAADRCTNDGCFCGHTQMESKP